MSTSDILPDVGKYVEKIRSLLARDIARYCLSLLIVFITLGLLLMNVYIIYSSSGLLATLLAFLVVPRPDINVQLEVEKREVKIGDKIDLKIRVVSSRGLGIITCRINIPENFEIVKGRTTFMIIKGVGRSEYLYDITLRAAKIGKCRITISEVELYHVLGVGGPKKISNIAEIELAVVPYIIQVAQIRRIRQARTRIPPITVSRLTLGAASTEFKEIRKYVPGDPVKNINWKATARVGSEVPLVNEYEKESISRVMIVPDLSERTNIGGGGAHVQEEILSIVFSIIRLLLRRGCRVHVVDPFSGEIRNVRGLKDYVRIYREIIERRSRGETGIDILEALGRQYSRIRNVDYLIILTYIDHRSLKMLERFRTLARRCKILVIDFDVSELLRKDVYGEYVSDMYRIYKIAFQKHLRKLGVKVLLHVSGINIGRTVNMILCQVS
ncbi:MAG: DUF58 domain-containing protein [Crenarchaeota archaeon]|nr:DUF58 domain-containing protein [Thermoproteota archaeon]